ncbi:MAG: hypothetical protein OEW96_10760 [Betaproteobacteria bacterium]|nr:hypothetical protein [Betaproteobacteria bacterium]MDH5212137.1 hypothetical protein [Betaproteobacteria bacterium]
MKRAALALVLCAALVPRTALAQELGRLFFTPEQRDALDARRKARLPDKPAALAPSPTTRIDGSVTRSSGRATIWLDGFAVPDGVQPEGLRIRRGADASRVVVNVGEDGRRVDLRVGETLDRASGEVKDVLGDGEVRIERRGAARR